MVTIQVLVELALLIGVVAGKACHGPHCSIPGPGEVESAIDQLHMHYNDKLCLEILLIDCTKHAPVGDERVCGNDGKEYADHCHFAHSRCEFLHSSGHVLKVDHAGPCSQTTSTTTSTVPTTVGQYSTVTSDHTVATISTARPVTTTPDPIYGIMQNVFCQNVDSLICNDAIDPKCGSDGYWYKNSCEFSKEKCTSTALIMAEPTFCSHPSA